MLADLQALVRAAIASDDASPALASVLVGGRDARQRLAIHRRHYETSLVTSLLDTFPATTWLVGSSLITEAARAFVRAQPPDRPCIAEYGAAFPRFLAAHAERLPYLRDFATLEWHVGRATLSVDAPALGVEDFAAIDPVVLASSPVVLQAGLSYVDTRWPIDTLLQFYLADSAPDEFSIDEEDVRLEIRGARGEFRMTRLSAGESEFRRELQRGAAVGDAAEHALECDATFEPGAALAALIAERLVVAIEQNGEAA